MRGHLRPLLGGGSGLGIELNRAISADFLEVGVVLDAELVEFKPDPLQVAPALRDVPRTDHIRDLLGAFVTVRLDSLQEEEVLLVRPALVSGLFDLLARGALHRDRWVHSDFPRTLR